MRREKEVARGANVIHFGGNGAVKRRRNGGGRVRKKEEEGRKLSPTGAETCEGCAFRERERRRTGEIDRRDENGERERERERM